MITIQVCGIDVDDNYTGGIDVDDNYTGGID